MEGSYFYKVCAACKHCPPMVGGNCGFESCVGELFKDFDSGISPSKTLLDEFAMAAMQAIVGKRPYMTASNEREMETALMIVRSDVRGAYEIAAAMMAERARRDEMGNVKEVK